MLIVNDERGEALAEELGADATYINTDVSSADAVQHLVRTAVKQFGRLDIMFNNAGIAGNSHARYLDDDLSDFDRVMNVDLLGVMLGCRYAGEVMARQGGGSIINTASIGGSLGGFGILTYRAAKAAVIAVTQSVAIDLGGIQYQGQLYITGADKNGYGGDGYGPWPDARDRTANAAGIHGDHAGIATAGENGHGGGHCSNSAFSGQ